MQAIYDLVIELAIFEKEPDAVKSMPEEYIQNFNNGLIKAFVADHDGEVVGMALYYDIFSTWFGKSLYLEDFVVKSSHRNMGIGQKLWDAFIAEAKTQGCRQVKWQVLDWNTDAINFYYKNNATIEKGWWNGKVYFIEK
jgi:GNAT superfamily N-acetyltransferase